MGKLKEINKTLLDHWMNTRILTHKVNSQAKISESMSNDGMKKGGGGGGGGDMTILYVPKKCEGSSLQVRKKKNETNNGENKER